MALIHVSDPHDVAPPVVVFAIDARSTDPVRRTFPILFDFPHLQGRLLFSLSVLWVFACTALDVQGSVIVHTSEILAIIALIPYAMSIHFSQIHTVICKLSPGAAHPVYTTGTEMNRAENVSYSNNGIQ